jgi:hypothetical protein
VGLLKEALMAEKERGRESRREKSTRVPGRSDACYR